MNAPKPSDIFAPASQPTVVESTQSKPSPKKAYIRPEHLTQRPFNTAALNKIRASFAAEKRR